MDGFKIIDLNFSSIASLNGSKSAFVSENVIKGMKRLYYQSGKINKEMPQKKAYELYQRISSIKPREFVIDDVIYTKNYKEKPLIIPFEVKKLKSIWLYYSLIYNENEIVEPSRSEKKSSLKTDDSYVLNNFDTLFEKLSKNISGVDLYVKELENMRQKKLMEEKVQVSKEKAFDLEQKKFEEYVQLERKKLDAERKAFQKEKKEELKKIEKSNKELAIRFQKLQNLTDELNKKITSLTGNKK